MNGFQQRLILRLLLLSIVFYAILYVVFTRLIIASMPMLLTVGLLFAINSLAFVIVTNTKDKNPRRFVYSYMTVSFGRLLVCGAFVFIYALTHRQDARVFAVVFFILYLFYAIVEVRAIYTFFKS
jgi:hypothetical protein